MKADDNQTCAVCEGPIFVGVCFCNLLDFRHSDERCNDYEAEVTGGDMEI